MTTAFVLFAVVLCWYCTLHLDGRGRTDAAVAADAVHDSDSVQKSWVGGYAVFECPVPHDIRDPFVARWTKDVSFSTTICVTQRVRDLSRMDPINFFGFRKISPPTQRHAASMSVYCGFPFFLHARVP